MVVDNTEKVENKRKVLDMIRDFIRTPSVDPKFRYEHILAYIELLKENAELSYAHYGFVKRVLEVEYGMIMLNYKQWEDEKGGS